MSNQKYPLKYCILTILLGLLCFLTKASFCQCPLTSTPSLVTQPSTVCGGGTSVFITSSVKGLNYVVSIAGVNVAWVTGTGYSMPLGTFTQSGTMVVTPSGCTPVSTTITQTVAPSGGTISSGGQTVICPGSSITLNFTPSDLQNYTYSWMINGVVQPASNSKAFIATQAGSYNLVMSNICGSKTITGPTLTTGSVPSGGSISSGGQTIICQGSSIALTFTPPDAQAYNYSWMINGVAQSNSNSKTFTATQAGNYSLKVSNTCGSETVTGPTLTSSWVPNGGSISSLGGQTVICPNSSINLTFTPPDGQNYTYSWMLNGTAIPNSNSKTYAATQGGYYSLKVSNTCGSETVAGPTLTTGTVPSGGSISSAGAQTVICPNSYLNLTFTPPDAQNYTYSWMLNGTALPNSNSRTYAATQAGSYTLQVSNTCGSQTVTGPTLTLGAVPSGGSISSGGQTIICANSSLTLTFTPPDAQNYTYSWMLNGTALPNSNSRTYAATQAGSYTLLVSNPCGSETVTGPSLTLSQPLSNPGNITGNTSLAQQTGSATYTITAANNATGYNWSLSDPTAGSIVGTGTSAVFTWNTNYVGTVTINVFAVGSCGQTTAATGLPVTVYLPPPSISYSVTSSPLSFIINKPISPITPSNTGGTIPSNTQFGTVSTLAGGSGFGYIDNTNGALALFNRSNGIVADQAGNVYVADYLNYVIRKITPSGSVSTFVGSGVFGSADGQGSAASFGSPLGISIDGLGNLYVLDYQKNNGYVALRKITPSGLVSTVIVNIGSTTIAIDTQNNIYLTGDTYSQVIKISASGGATYITGNSALIAPFGIAVDKNGYVYVADRSGNQIKVMNPTTGVWSVFAGSGAVGYADGTGRSAIFQNPNGVAVDGSGNVYVADQNVYQGGQVGSVLIRKITPQGVVTTIAGGSTAVVNGVGKNADLGQTISITLDGYGNLYTLESLIATDIRKIVLTGYDISPALPQGLTLDSKTGIISGTPTAYSPKTTYTITGYNASGTSSTTITLGVNPGLPLNLSQTQNYIVTYQPRVAGIIDNNSLAIAANNRNQVQTTVQYVDGLGRPIQTVQYQASPNGKDVILPQAYDQFDREVTKYLPYAITGTVLSDGSFKTNALKTDSGQSAFYITPPTGVISMANPYAQTAFDNSPLNRPIEQGAPGAAWQLSTSGVTGSGHTVKMVYTTNNAISFKADSINGRQVALFYTTIGTDMCQNLVANGYYPANTLTVTISKDENWQGGRAGTVEEYKDIDGRVVLKRIYNYANSTLQMLSTYYVYDDNGHLAFVLPPMAGADGAGTITAATLNNLCYQYLYDGLGRSVQKKIPGKGWEYIVYNNMDQPVATQDSLQRANKQWVFTKYDALQRPVMSGLWNNNNVAITRASLQTTLNGISGNYYEAALNSGNGYSNVAWPTTNVTAILNISYYDGYTNIPSMPAAYSPPTGASLATRGEVTANLTAVLNTTANKLWKVIYYDNLGRSIQTYAQHYLGGVVDPNNYDAISTTYDFTNVPTTVTRQHYKNAGANNPAQLALTIFNKYIYDQVGRKLRSWETINNGNAILLSQMVYNEVGQVMNKQLHSTDSTNFAQTIGYNYNERGWLLASSAPLFAMQLQYNANPANLIKFAAQYNGNIGSQLWGTPGSLSNNYRYYYDNLNRLTSGVSNAYNNERGITYDLMGNITKLSRVQAGTVIDSLSYTYTSGTNATNQLQSINDAAINNATNNATIPTGTTSYKYDGNGNMLSNTNATITTKNKSFTYNLLNLPQLVTVPSGTSTFIYDATGNKLRKITALGTTNDTIEYISGIQYKNRNIDFIQTEEGKIAFNKNTGVYDYEYYLGDNLGNTRVTFNIQNNIATSLQRDDYMPFGYEISNGSPANPKNEYLYNKKELQEELTEYDYGARFYDPLLGRWMVVDAKAEDPTQIDLSPYAYVGNNPVDKTDPDGNCPKCPVPSEGGTSGFISGIGEGFTGFFTNIADAVTHPVETIKSQFSVESFKENFLNTATMGQYGFAKEAFRLSLAAANGDTRTLGNAVGNKAAEITTAVVLEGAGKAFSALKAVSKDVSNIESVQVTEAYKRPNNATTVEQRASVQDKPCVTCGRTEKKMIADHKTPLVKEHYQTGTIDKTNMRSNNAVQPQCATCSAKQGAEMSKYSKVQKKLNGF